MLHPAALLEVRGDNALFSDASSSNQAGDDTLILLSWLITGQLAHKPRTSVLTSLSEMECFKFRKYKVLEAHSEPYTHPSAKLGGWGLAL